MTLPKRKPLSSSDDDRGEDVRKSSVSSDHYTNDTSPQSNSKLNIALELARRGFFVFPLVPLGTAPAVDDWKNRATINENDIRGLWAGDSADCNVGIYTGKYKPSYAPGRFTTKMRSLVVVESQPNVGLIEGKYDPLMHSSIRISKPEGGGYGLYSTLGLARAGDFSVRGKNYDGFKVHGEQSYIVAPGSDTPAGKYTVTVNHRNWRLRPERNFIFDMWYATKPVYPDFDVVDDGDDDADYPTYIPSLVDLLKEEKGSAVISELLAKYYAYDVYDLRPSQLKPFLDDCLALAANHDPDIENGESSTDVNLDVFPSHMFADVEPDLNDDELVGGFLLAGTMSVLYGDSNTGKTFFALHLALSIARGAAWYGRKVKPGLVVYVAAEAGRSVERRIQAAKIAHGGDEAPLAVIPSTIDMRSSDADTQKLIATIRQRERQSGHKVALVVIDTLARALAGGNENTSNDMGTFVEKVDRIRAETGAHVMVVHHSGKDKAKGARGHSSLRAATDTEIELAADDKMGAARATVTKQRDLAVGDVFGFKLRSVVIGTGTDGQEKTSCVVVPVHEDERNEAQLAPAAAKALTLVRQIANGDATVKLEAWREVFYAECDGDKSKARVYFNRVRKELEAAGAVSVTKGIVTLGKKGGKA